MISNNVLSTEANSLLNAQKNYEAALESLGVLEKNLEQGLANRSGLDEPPTEAELLQATRTLNSATDVNGSPYSFITLPLTQNNVTTSWGGNVNFKGSYVNYYVANDAVLVPIYNDPNDSSALSIIQTLYPSKTIVGIDCSNMFYEGGMVHCVTQQQPISLGSTNINQIYQQNNRLIKTVDVLGRRTQHKSNTLLFYIYNDGTVEKKIIIE